MRKEVSQFNRRYVITASEIGEFAYCAKAWYLKRCGEKAESPQLKEGTVFHAQHGAVIAKAVQMKQAGKKMSWVALLLFIGLLLLGLIIGVSK